MKKHTSIRISEEAYELAFKESEKRERSFSWIIEKLILNAYRSKNKDSKVAKKSLEERKEEFKNQLRKFKDLYSNDMLIDFGSYWCEHGQKDKKMRYEKQASFDMSRRLSTWAKRSVNDKPKRAKTFKVEHNKKILK